VLLCYHAHTRWTLTLTYDFYFQSYASYFMTHTYTKLKFRGESVHEIKWKQADGQEDATGCFVTFPANAVGNNSMYVRRVTYRHCS